MNTIVRVNGHVVETATVVKTIQYLIKHKPGFYSRRDIQSLINQQVEPHEQFTDKMVLSALLKIFARHKRGY